MNEKRKGGFVPDSNEAYLSRCTKMLKGMGLPLDGWRCRDVIDVREDDSKAPLETCDICGCSKVRYVHIMEHPDIVQSLSVGCICAGVMEGDIFGAKEREQELRKRANRRRNFIKKPWETGIFDGLLFYKSKLVYMIAETESFPAGKGRDVETPVRYSVYVDDERTTEYKGRPVCDPLTAKYAAFELIDPIGRTEAVE